MRYVRRIADRAAVRLLRNVAYGRREGCYGSSHVGPQGLDAALRGDSGGRVRTWRGFAAAAWNPPTTPPPKFEDLDRDAQKAEQILNFALGESGPTESSGASTSADLSGDRDALLERAFEHARIAAERGSPRGSTVLALMYRDGLSVDEDEAHAELLLGRAADAGDPQAQLILGVILYESLDVASHMRSKIEKESREGLLQLNPAQPGTENSGIVVEDDGLGARRAKYHVEANSDNAKSPAELVRAVRKERRKAGFSDAEAFEYERYKQGLAAKAQDARKERAMNLLRSAADHGLHQALVALGNTLVKENPKEAIALYQKAAKEGHDPNAHFNLGQMYFAGVGDVEPNEKLAQKHFLMAAQLGDASSQFFVGHAYRTGDLGLEVDESACLQYVTLAEGQGHGPATYYLALMHRNGEGGLEKSATTFRKYLDKACAIGHGEALNCLADMHYKGTDGAKEDHKLALKSYEAAAATGFADAACSAAAMHYHGHGTAQDYHKAFTLYQDAAVMGSEAALRNIASMYYNGEGVPKSDTLAEEFLRRADELLAQQRAEAAELSSTGTETETARPRAMPHRPLDGPDADDTEVDPDFELHTDKPPTPPRE